MPAPPVAIEAHDIRKAFGATAAVDGVSLAIDSGSVHALLGENGAGKSTIVKLLSGLLTPDSGSVQLASPRVAHQCGIQTAFQEMTLVRDLTVLENVLMPYAPANAIGILRRRAAETKVRAHFARLRMDDIRLSDEVRTLDLAVRQKIEIARALFRKPRILLLDEPTSTLTGRDVDWLGEIIEAQKARGATIVFISHRLREVRRFCDTLTILRNGRHIASGRVADLSDAEVVRLIIGRSLGQTFPPRPPASARHGREVLRLEGLSTAGKR